MSGILQRYTSNTILDNLIEQNTLNIALFEFTFLSNTQFRHSCKDTPSNHLHRLVTHEFHIQRKRIDLGNNKIFGTPIYSKNSTASNL